jgi:hypothetical protein
MSEYFKPGHGADNLTKAIAAAIADQMVKEAEPVIQQALKDMEAKMRRRARECALAVLDRSIEMHGSRDVLTIRIQQPNGGAL